MKIQIWVSCDLNHCCVARNSILTQNVHLIGNYKEEKMKFLQRKLNLPSIWFEREKKDKRWTLCGLTGYIITQDSAGNYVSTGRKQSFKVWLGHVLRKARDIQISSFYCFAARSSIWHLQYINVLSNVLGKPSKQINGESWDNRKCVPTWKNICKNGMKQALKW